MRGPNGPRCPPLDALAWAAGEESADGLADRRAPGPGEFAMMFHEQNGVAAAAVNERLRSGKDTMPVYISNTAPPYRVEVNSDCAWVISVIGTP